MNQRTRFIALTAATLIIFLAALATPLTVFADDGAPPVPSGAEVPPDETQTDQVSPSVGGTAEGPALSGEGGSEGTEGGTAPSSSVEEIIEQIPEGVDLVLLDAAGEVVPLAAEQAEGIIVTGDPIWCAAGVTPDPADPLCSPAFGDMSTLLLWLLFFPGMAADGTIWIEDSYDSSVNDPLATAFTIDGNSYTTWRNYALVVQGGWDGVTDSTTISGTSEFNVPLKIINWLDAVTVSDIVVIDTAGIGLEVTTTGDIEVSDVIADNNALEGAKLNNTAGSGEVEVTNSTFGQLLGLGNGAEGLEVDSNGKITLDTVVADNNVNSGASLDNHNGTGDILVDAADFSFNGVSSGGAGLFARSAGAITVLNTIADVNTLTGLQLNNSFGTDPTDDVIVDTVVATFNGSLADGPSGSGVWVLSNGDITLENVRADDNYWDGARVNNSDGSGFIFVQDGLFRDNGTSAGGGLVAYGSGDVTLQSVTAEDNFANGAYLENSIGPGNLLVNVGTFDGNGFDYGIGLDATFFGNITLLDVTANDNYQDGAYLDNSSGTGFIFLDTSYFNGNGLAAYASGLNAFSYGNIDLEDVEANNNSYAGAILYNTGGTGGISVYTDTWITTNFNDNGLWGLSAESDHNISLTDVFANGNILSDGAYLDNSTGTGNIYVYAFNSSTTSFSDNGSTGLYVLSNGNINLTDVFAGDGADLGSLGNGEDGAYLDNSGGSGSISIYADLNTSTDFSDNGDNGLYALSGGQISLTDVLANGNVLGNGAYLNNSGGAGDVDVYADNLANTTFNGNGMLGLEIYSSGDITLTDVQASGNGGDGAYLNSTTGAGNILVDPSMFNGNFSDGLEVFSQGSITLTDVQANGNSEDGAVLDSSVGGGSILIDPGVFNGNGDYGLQIRSGGQIAITDVLANGNGTSGAVMTTTKGIGGVLIDQATFDGNVDYGLQIFSRGSTFLTDVEADGNGSDGANIVLLRCNDLSVDSSEFASNGGYGLVVQYGHDLSLGTITYGGNSAGDSLLVFSKCHKKGPPALPPLPLHVVLVAGGEDVPLDCVQFRGTILVLPNGDRISLPCPLLDQVSLGRVEANDLPQILGHQYVFISSMDAQVTREGQPVTALDHAMTVDFVIPPADATSALVILHWNGSEWDELGGYITPDNYFETNVNVTGLFVLVKRQ